MRTSLKTLALLGLLLALPTLAFAQGRSGGSNQPPTAVIVTPGAGAQFDAGTDIAIEADAHDSDGRVARVDFYQGTTLLGRVSKAPWRLVWRNVPAGEYSLTAVATDNAKATGRSAPVVISVETRADTTPPSVPTGLASNGQTASSITLTWNASSDEAGGSGVAGYDVFRDGVRIASPASTGHTDSGLSADTAYSYAVRARDHAGNTSALSAAISVRTARADGDGGDPARVVGYFTQWGIYTQGYRVKELDTSGAASRLTHLIYAFGNVRDNRCELGVLKATDPDTGEGGDAYADYSRTYSAAESVDGKADTWGQPLRGHWNQLKKLKARHPHLKVMISLGGWTWSRGFAEAARPENREAFVASCIDAYIHGNLPLFDHAGGPGAAAGVFDGFDIDWEYPAACGLTCGNAEDSANFTALLAEFRRQLDAVRPGLLLSAAVGAGIDKIRVTEPGQYQRHVDFINLMTYDFHGSWESRTNFHSALFDSPNDPSTGDAKLYNTHDAVEAMLARGVPASKLHLGVASYGRGWTEVKSTNNGLYQSGKPAPGSLGSGIESYRVLAARDAPRFVDPHSRASWTYDGKTFWSFDDPQTLADKTTYAKVQGLGGVFLWDFSGDDAAGSLITAISDGLR